MSATRYGRRIAGFTLIESDRRHVCDFLVGKCYLHNPLSSMLVRHLAGCHAPIILSNWDWRLVVTRRLIECILKELTEECIPLI